MPWDLVEDFGIYEGPSPTKDSPGWKKPRRIVVPNLMPARLAELKRVAPEIEFIPVKDAEEAAKVVEDADAIVGFCTPDIVKAGKHLRWIQVGHAGVDKELGPELVGSKIVLTNAQRLSGPNVADQASALMLALTRRGREASSHAATNEPEAKAAYRQELHGKPMRLVGLSDPERLPVGQALGAMSNVVISPPVGGQSAGAKNRQWRLVRESVRRFVGGEALLCVVDKERGY